MFIVVGSGASGATIAKELASLGKEVLILECGSIVDVKKAATTYRTITSHDIEILQNICIGGSTVTTLGNSLRLDNELKDYYLEAEKELGVNEPPDSHIGNGTRLLLETSSEWKKMPKSIDFSKCRSCGKCAFGCPYDAKWTAIHYINYAISKGAKLLPESPVDKVIIKGEKAIGVRLINGREIMGDAVILCAGAIDTPRILIKSGIEDVGSGFFVDIFITVGGIVENKKLCFDRELNMAIFINREGYLLSPHYSIFLLPKILSKGIRANKEEILGIMVKIADEPNGIVKLDSVEKPITRRDFDLLERGKKEAEELLIHSGVNPNTIVYTHLRGAHPGGSCSSITDGYTPILESLYVADASILKGPLGMPPMLTIIAKSKKIASTLVGRA
ncbi:MAG: GMC family oxidoreductase N-terminal domain-containing protein [Nitrososphaerota archaeon]|nr:GMC family oxidoreductase N-terminal domain-containing protein [Nitrososphaerota archaeon]